MLQLLDMNPLRMVFGLTAILALAVAATAVIVGSSPAPVLALSLIFALFGAAMARQAPGLAPIGAAVALIGQAIAFTAAFEGHPWQLDSHMMFFALLACLVCLRSVTAILVAAGMIAVHHLSLSFVMPALIYPSGGAAENIGRTLFHAVIVLMETGALVMTVVQLNRFDRAVQAQTTSLEASLADADRARQEALASEENADAARKEALEAQNAAETALEKAREADEVRQASEAEKRRVEEERRAADATKSREQAAVVDTLREALAGLEAGDLSTRITEELPEDYASLRSGFNTAMQTIEELVSVVAQRSEKMDADIREISIATDNLARRTEAQAKNLTDTSEALDHLTQSVRETASNVQDAHSSAKTAQSSAETSGEVVTNASKTMAAIKTESGEIGKIVELIEGISFQTNLLALNAGVEAARAGDAGLGFAVVASEVRGLAQRSSDSATSIRTLIERSGTEVENGTTQIAETVAALEGVKSTILDIASKMDLVTGNTQSQSDQISTLNASIGEIEKVTQQNAAMFEETNAACANLASAAKALHELTLHFQVSGEGARSERAA